MKTTLPATLALLTIWCIVGESIADAQTTPPGTLTLEPPDQTPASSAVGDSPGLQAPEQEPLVDTGTSFETALTAEPSLTEIAPAAKPLGGVSQPPVYTPPPGFEPEYRVRGFIGGVVGAGFALNGQIDSDRRPDVDTSVLFALRGGLLLGEKHRNVITFEVAPVSNKIDWSLRATPTFLLSYGRLHSIHGREDWAWFWKVGAGVGGGLDYRFLVAAQLDLLTFNYKMSERLWVDFGVPSIRFYIETASQARYALQFVFPLGITFAPERRHRRRHRDTSPQSYPR